MTLRSIFTSMTVLLLALASFVALGASTADGLTASAYMSRLDGNGYEATVDDSVTHDTLSVDGKIIVVESNGKTAKVEIIEYASHADLLDDWIAVNGQGPRPRVTTSDFAGKTLYWNLDSVLAVDYNAPNDALVARGAANAYLGIPGQGGQQPSGTPAPTTPAGSPTATPGGLPNSGGDIGESSESGGWAIVLGIVGVSLIAIGAAHVYSVMKEHQGRE